MKQQKEHGAVAVEFAILLPVLLLLVMGIMEFGRAYNAQVALTHAAREGVRVMAITNDRTQVRTVVKNTAVTLSPSLLDSNIAITPPAPGCTPAAQATVTITYNLSSLTGIAGPFKLTGKGVMRCGG